MSARRTLLVVAIVLLALPAAPAECPLYRLNGPPVTAVTGAFAGVADFDGDGRDDLLTVDAIVYRFTDRVALPFTIPGAPGGGAAIADVNGDGRPDVVVAERSGLTAWLNQGGRQFSPVRTGYAVAAAIGSVAVADFNDDGNLDVAVGCVELPLFLGNGTGAFAPGVPWGVNPAIGTGDFDGDGQADVVMVASARKRAFFFYGDGHGDRKEAAETASSGEVQVVADFDRDGRDDIATGTPLSVIYGAPAGGAVRSATIDDAVTSFKTVAADVNGDGWLDLVVSDGIPTFDGSPRNDSQFLYGPQRVVVYLNHGGSFAKAWQIELRTWDIAIADVNGDGVPDLALSLSDALVTLAGRGDGRFVEPPAIETTQAPRIAADFDGDGDDDVLLFSANIGRTAVAWNDDGKFQLVRVAQNLALSSAVAADVDGDGVAEVIAETYLPDDVVVVLKLARDGSFHELARMKAGTYPRSIAAGRFKGTAMRQIAVTASGMHEVQVFDVTSSGAPYATFDLGMFSDFPQIVAADVNRDGADDLWIMADNPAGSPQAPHWSRITEAVSTRSGFTAPVLLRDNLDPGGKLAAGDFNGDGAMDLAFTPIMGSTRVFYGDGAGAIGAEQSLAIPGPAVVADLDGDGRTDLILRNTLLFGSPEGLRAGSSYLLKIFPAVGLPVPVRMHRGLPWIVVPTQFNFSYVYTSGCSGRLRPAGR